MTILIETELQSIFQREISQELNEFTGETGNFKPNVQL